MTAVSNSNNNFAAPLGASKTAAHSADAKATIFAQEYVPLTPESLLIFCQTQLRDLDDKIAKNMNGQNGLVALQQEVTNIQTELRTYAGGGKDEEERINAKATVDKLSGKIDNAIAHAIACGDKALAKSLGDVKDKLNGNSDGKVIESELKDMNGMLDTALSSCRSGAEMKMIELQSLISKRATGLQLVTGMMNNVNESMKAIAGNIGR